MTPKFQHVITNKDELRAVLGTPARLTVAKTLHALDGHSRDFIARSPFLVIASGDGRGHMDVSAKGDPGGFVEVLNDTTLAIPDRPGNRRADTFLNVLNNPAVGLLFLVPGKSETLRVNGHAQIVHDSWLLEQMAERGKTPALVLVVHIEEVFFHCAKCVLRSGLWESETWPSLDGLASLARVLADQTGLSSEAEVDRAVEESYRARLY
ncbi:MAG: pyridoxamine 5'-phosphate oxidase family protein [Anaerolineae bacterium]